MGWAGVKNGALLALAAPVFDVFVTIDANLKYQQNLTSLGLAVIVLHAVSNDISNLRPLAANILKALDSIQPGQVIEVGDNYP